MLPEEVLARLGGVARAEQLLRHLSERELARAVDTGSVLRLARGRYGLPASSATHAAAARLSGTITHLSAAVEHGWPVLRQPERPWIAVPRNRNLSAAQRRGIQVAWSDARGTVTSPLRTVLDCARTLPFAQALAVADSALRSGVVEQDELRCTAAGLRGGGAVTARRVAAEATRLAANPLESALRAVGLEVPMLRLEPQVEIELDGFTVHPDLVDRRLRLVVEAEGWLYHSGRERFALDLQRYTQLLVERWTPARFGHDDVVLRPTSVRETLESLARTGTIRANCTRCA